MEIGQFSFIQKIKKLRFIRLTYLLVGFLSFGNLNAQLVIADATTAPYTPENLVRNVFLGSGVEVTNVSFNGSPSAVGYFSGAEENINLERGIVISTSRVKGIDQANNSSEDVGVDDLTGGPNGDEDLVKIATGPLEDVFSYTISFIPSADTLRFRYVFASEEYPQFVCDQFNDIFGFFITGPKPSGGSYESENIALVPDPSDPSGLTFTNIPVSIDNIQDGSNGNCPPSFETFYNINPQGTQDFKYDGFTSVFTAEAIVTPCEEYTIKLAIADVGDSSFGSCVFLEAKSFGTGTLAVELNSLSVDGSLAEGCGVGFLEFSLPEVVDEDYVIDIDFEMPMNAATPGVDYPEIPAQLVIPAGSKSVSIPLEAYLDNESEMDEVISFEIQVDLCTRKRFDIIIRDDELFDPILPDDVTICEGETLLINSELNPNFILPPDPYFENRDTVAINPEMAPIYSEIVVSGVLPTILSLDVIESVCIMGLEHRDLTDFDIYLIAPGGQFLELSTDNGFKPNNIADVDRFENTCFTPQATMNINNGNNLAGPIFDDNSTYTGEFKPEGVWSDLSDGQNPTNGTWSLLITDDTNGFEGVLEGWSITFKSFYGLDYEWSSNPSSVICEKCEDIEVSPAESTEYTLKITDSYGCERSESINVTVSAGIDQPSVNCTAVSENSIEIAWTEVAGSIGYEVRIDGGDWLDVGTNLSFDFTGLASGSDFLLEVRAVANDCSSQIAGTQCSTDDCAKPTLSVNINQEISCPGGEDGAVTIEAVGNAPFTFDLSGMSNSTGIFENVGLGSNTVTVTDNTGCVASIDFTMPGPEPFVLIPRYSLSDPCNVVSNITGSFEITGGTPPYSYFWSNLTTSPEASNLSPGTYFLTITDANTCAAVGTLEVPDLDQFVFTLNTTPPLCKGQNNGTATVVEVSGNGPYTYLWEDGFSEATNDQLAAGFYVVTVVDNLGCAVPKTFTIAEGPELNLEISVVPISCAGLEDGSASVEVTGGLEPYSYTWDEGTSNGSITEGLPPGIFTVTISDANNCTVSEMYEINEPEGITFEILQEDNLCSDGSEGEILISQVSSPNGPVTILWEDGNSAYNRVGLTNGSYCFTLSDGSVCVFSDCIEVSSPEVLSLVEEIQGPTCENSEDGNIAVSVSGGTGPYEFEWLGPKEDLPSASIISDLKAGEYTLTVTDANQCSRSFSFTVSAAAPITTSQTVFPISCNGASTGQIFFSASGGRPPFNYAWAGPDGFATSTNNISDLTAGIYTVSYTDANGCGGSQEFLVEQPNFPLLANISSPDTICFGNNNGRVSVQPSGGTPPYSFLWGNGEASQEIIGLSADSYFVTVTDSRNCQVTESSKVFENEEISLQISQMPSSCFQTNDGNAIIEAILYGNQEADLSQFDIIWNTPTNQDGPLVENLVGGNTYIATVSDRYGCSASQAIEIGSPDQVGAEIISLTNVSCFGEVDGALKISGTGGSGSYEYQWDVNANLSTSDTVSVLRKGSYAVTVTDENGCVGFGTFGIEEPRPLSMDFRVIDVSCFGGSDGRAEAVVQGGVGPYSFSWTNNATGMAIENTISEQYNVTVTDANGCTLVDSTKIKEPEEALMVEVDIQDVTCFGESNGRVEIDASGGSGFYRYSLDGVEFTSSDQFVNLQAGNYTVYVSDFRGCTDTFPEIVVFEPAELVVDLGDDLVIPFGEAVQLNPTIQNASGSISLQWKSSNLELLSCRDCLNPLFQGEREASYELQIIDEKGCVANDFLTIRLQNYSPFYVPTAFTPNGDQENDVLRVFGGRIAIVETFQIFNRWGELVFETNNAEIGDAKMEWDGVFKGEIAPSGLYYWFAEVQFENGFRESFNGNTTLLR